MKIAKRLLTVSVLAIGLAFPFTTVGAGSASDVEMANNPGPGTPCYYACVISPYE